MPQHPQRIVYQAIDGLKADLQKELELKGIRVLADLGELILAEGDDIGIVWAQNCWRNVENFSFTSIAEAARHLKALQRNWAHVPYQSFRRGELIQDQLPKYPKKPIAFLSEIPSAPMGNWCLLGQNEMLYSTQSTSPFPGGVFNFIEDHQNPPSRAYLKLWELMTVYQIKPQAGDICIDLGSCPGGWTWVLQGLGCDVISVDKAPLDPRIMRLERVRFIQESAFGLDPQRIGQVDWLFSDIICYPEKLLRVVEKWRQLGLAKNFVCTIKFQGPTDHGALKAFAEIPGSRIVHFHHNKHEVTWINLS